ncbi:beta-1,3-galactosyl-O-glycosyl-glycoprotein beta-1,6-N-acetylglucosaminyltransferase [Octopus bimaculoides]|uniref:beta-1,3-galactosyl-O-glycosyl-glycoprotein beta-1,6-N-acetylglucosaminyltransferase n=1 Tax=Octopus bimaculoides TaxID=37653 RepID=UPI0022E0B092|nr:beta-1,3-galactosyl-O-glycosyl-glycoprotein beta-1,6-N-acetylglucosaminyltransferase [Octopus bimaculoides]
MSFAKKERKETTLTQGDTSLRRITSLATFISIQNNCSSIFSDFIDKSNMIFSCKILCLSLFRRRRLRKWCAFHHILYRQKTRYISLILFICLMCLYFLNIKPSPPENENILTYDDTPMDPFDCAALIRQDEFASSNAETYSILHPHVFLPIGEYTKKLCKDCDEFRKRGRYVSMENVTNEEKDFPLAYSIVLYKEPDQVEHLLRAIYRPHNYYCIHVDKSSDPLILSDVKAIAECLPNVYIASHIIDVEWGKFSETEAELICMKDLLKYKKWKYFINLTGQEYPLKTNLQIVRIAKAFKGANDIAGVRGNFDFRTKYRYVNFRRMGLKPPPPHNITVSKGSIHITASRGYVEFLIMDRRSQEFINWVRDTRNPDETLFSTMNHNPHLRVPGSFNGMSSMNYFIY